MDEPFFSIIIPIYNSETYLKDCIDSVINQRFINYEVLLIDDGSTDCSSNICLKYQEKNSRIHYFRKENEGQIAARYYGVCQAKGEFLLFLDSDDFFQIDSFAKIYTYLKKTHADCIVFGLSRILNGKEITVWSEEKEEVVSFETKRELYKKVLFSEKYNSICRKAVRRGLLQDKDYHSFYRIRHGEDLIQSLSIYKEAKKICFIHDPLYCYRVNENSISNSQTIENYESPFLVKKLVYDFLVEEKVFNKQDFEEYKKHCLDVVIENIVKIYRFQAPFFEKCNLYSDLLSDAFFKSFLSRSYHCQMLNWKRRIILYAFEKKRFRVLFILLSTIR